jgi:DtxR family Mn-dependent transcriptional regulator
MQGEVAANDGETVSVSTGNGTTSITASVAETVSVIADPSPPPRTALPEQLVLGRERYGR